LTTLVLAFSAAAVAADFTGAMCRIDASTDAVHIKTQAE
jgi:hypothetical protein